MHLILGVNNEKTGFKSPSEFARARLAMWMKKYTAFKIEPIEKDSVRGRRYLEAAVIPEYCKYQYNIDPRDTGKDEARRMLFKRDFNYEIIKDRNGNPERIPLSTKGKANRVTQQFTEWAEQNGCPIPNPDFYKLWRDTWSMDFRFETFHDFLAFLGLECDAMPSAQTLSKLQ